MNTTNSVILADSKKDGSLELSRIILNEDYVKKWNIGSEDFFHLTKNGEIINPALFREGAFKVDFTQNYFLLLKYTEAFYPDSITKDKSRKPHLEGNWCIVDKNGVEKNIVKKVLSHPYIIKDSCVYSIDQCYYNIETGYFYGKSYDRLESNEFIFIEDKYGEDKSKRGVIRINKKDGTFEIYK